MPRLCRLAVLPVFLATAALGQDLRTERLSVDVDAFSSLTGAGRLRAGSLESEGGINLPVRIPVVGIGSSFEGTIEGLEAGGDLEATVVIDQLDGNWYAQQLQLPEGTLIVEGEALRLAEPIAIERSPGATPTLADPEITFIGEDYAAEGDDAQRAEAPTEVFASFDIGGALYRVTLICKEDRLDSCADDATIRELIGALEILGRGTLE